MKRLSVIAVSVTISVFAAVCYADDAAAAHGSGRAYLFSYFVGGGETGLHLAYSTDGYDWKPLKDGKSFLAPPVKVSKLIRDPSIYRSSDGTFHMVWTGSWTGKSIGYACSQDLIKWTDIRSVPVMENEPKTRNVWAPEIFHDEKTKLNYIIWSSTIPDRFPETAGSSETDYNHRLYYTTTKDFKTFTETQLYWNPGHNVIDAFLAKDGDKYLLFYKDETKFPTAQKTILLAASNIPNGHFDKRGVVSHTNWVEGPAALKIGSEWFVYYDCYTKSRYGAVKSSDLKHWENICDKIHFPKGARHGTAFEVDKQTLEKLLEL